MELWRLEKARKKERIAVVAYIEDFFAETFLKKRKL